MNPSFDPEEEGFLDRSTALELVRDEKFPTRAPKEVEEAVWERIAGCVCSVLNSGDSAHLLLSPQLSGKDQGASPPDPRVPADRHCSRAGRLAKSRRRGDCGVLRAGAWDAQGWLLLSLPGTLTLM